MINGYKAKHYETLEDVKKKLDRKLGEYIVCNSNGEIYLFNHYELDT